MSSFALVPRILRSRLRMLLNGAFNAGSARRGWTIIGVIAVAGIMFATHAFADVIFSVDVPDPVALRTTIAGALVMLSGFTAITSITFALSSLYFARDLETLHVLPLRPRVILLSRMLTQLLLGAGLGAVLVGPPLLAYAQHRGQLLMLPLMAVATLAVAATPLALATGFTVTAVRAIPARWVRDAGGLVVTLAVVVTAAINLAVRGPEGFTQAGAGTLQLGRMGAGPGGSLLLPTGWGARALEAYSAGDLATGLLWTLPLVALAALLLAGVAVATERLYVSGYQRNATASRGSARRLGRRRQSLRRLPTWLLLAAKDLREISRDASQLGQLLLPLVMFAFYIGSPGRNPADLGGGALPRWYGTALTAAFASLFAASGIALRGVGSEGGRIWLLRTAPLDIRHLLAAKYAVGWAIAAFLGVLLLWVGQVRSLAGAAAILPPSLLLTVIIGGLVGLATGMGALRPRLDWTDPRRAVGVGTVMTFLALGSVYLAVAFIIIGLPYALNAAGAAGTALSVAALVLVAGLTAGVALGSGALRLRALET